MSLLSCAMRLTQPCFAIESRFHRHWFPRMSVQPLNEAQRRLVIAEVDTYLAHAGLIYRQAIPAITIRFDLSGRAAGMYRVRHGQREIRFNPYIFAKDYDEGITQTVPHEVAHYVIDLVYGLQRGLRRVRPHGLEWRALMLALGAEPRVTGRYDLTDVPLRTQRRFSYRCACPHEHQLTTRRHNAIGCGQVCYLCRRCGEPLRHVMAAVVTT